MNYDNFTYDELCGLAYTENNALALAIVGKAREALDAEFEKGLQEALRRADPGNPPL